MKRAVLALILMLFSAQFALAHPHVWVGVSAQLIYTPEGEVSGVRHSWSFDDAYSAFAAQGLDKNNDGIYSTEELSELAKTNVESLADFGYFTFLKVDGKLQALNTPQNYTLSYDKKKMTLQFTLPLKDKIKSKSALGLEVYDPTYFVSFGFNEGDAAVTTQNAPSGCSVKIHRPTPDPKVQEMLAKLSADVSLEGTEFGVQMASKALVVCP